MSERASAGFPCACSGDMYATVPITAPATLRAVGGIGYTYAGAVIDQRQPEVEQLDAGLHTGLQAGLRHQNIGRFQVAMRDAFVMSGFERAAMPSASRTASGRSQRPARRSAVDVLHDDVIRADIVNLADIGMIQRGDGFGFPLEAFGKPGVGNLDGHIAIEPRIARFPHRSHAAGA